jgi:Galactose oxidase-like, Early set domain/Bacterial Ig-like domain (group 1)
MATKSRIRQIRLWTVAGLVAAASLRCGGDNVQPTNPTQIAMAGGNAQNGLAGQPLASPLVVLVTDAGGNGVPGVQVHWTASGGGSVSNEVVETGNNGRASVQRILGPDLGQQTTSASVDGLEGSPVTFVSTAVESGGLGSIVITTNPPVSALDGEVFDPAVQPVVQVKDFNGNPASGVEVTATVSSGATLEGTTTATSDAAGVAAFGDLGIRGTGSSTLEFAAGGVTVTSSPVQVGPLSREASVGSWSPVVNWDIVPLHMALMPNGKIFAWGRSDVGGDTLGLPRIWDPSTGAPPVGLPPIVVSDMLFCAGLTLTPDGNNLMLAGGHHMDAAGIDATYLFTRDGVPSKQQPMAFGRWYPTLTVLPDGRILTMAGHDERGNKANTPEVWDGTQWTQLPGGASVAIPYYPRNFVAPDGRIFYAGERVMSRWFSYSGTGSWTDGPKHIWPFNREYGSAVMYDAGKVLYVGGGGDLTWTDNPDPVSTRSPVPTATAEKIDLTGGANPQWQDAGSMAVPRRHLNATVLPDGTVLVTGGTSGGGFDDVSLAHAALNAEVWDPKAGQAGQWTTLAKAADIPRVYHSVSMLLPDGTVLHGASGNAMINNNGNKTPAPDEKSHQTFSPPYLFKGARPVITSAPGSVGYGQTFSVVTPNAAQITDVRWIRLGAVTHAFDQSARANTLSFTRTATGVDVTAPLQPELAPPGPYLLFVLNRNGVPSKGQFITVQ